MKRFLILLTLVGLTLSLSACADSYIQGAGGGDESSFNYVHVDGLGSENEISAHILFENENLGFVQYQVAYTSCTCRDQVENVGSLVYIELNNDGTVKTFRFDYWGDSIKSPDHPIANTQAEVEEQYIDAHVIDNGIDYISTVDAMPGTTVTTDNIRRLLIGLITYHNEKYNS